MSRIFLENWGDLHPRQNSGYAYGRIVLVAASVDANKYIVRICSIYRVFTKLTVSS